eukprot:6178108-Pleurochrysis_carterae.AAC.1
MPTLSIRLPAFRSCDTASTQFPESLRVKRLEAMMYVLLPSCGTEHKQGTLCSQECGLGGGEEGEAFSQGMWRRSSLIFYVRIDSKNLVNVALGWSGEVARCRYFTRMKSDNAFL